MIVYDLVFIYGGGRFSVGVSFGTNDLTRFNVFVTMHDVSLERHPKKGENHNNKKRSTHI